MFYGASSIILQRAEELRNTMTSAERIIWKHLHINPWRIKFRRQHPISNYVVDFYCHQLKLVIEIDENIHDHDEVKRNDTARENELKSLGLRVMRFKNEQVYKNSNSVLEQIDETVNLLRSSPSGDGGKKKLLVIKIGGNIIDDELKLSQFLKAFTEVEANKILVHGGGKLATKLAEQMNIPQQLVEGRRITDSETLRIVTMVYAGHINKNIVAQLQAQGSNAIGICGADGNAIKAHKRLPKDSSKGSSGPIDYGFVGDVDAINVSFFQTLLSGDTDVIVAPITHDGNGQLLNTNADTIAQEIAKALSSVYQVELIYSFEKAGVLLNAEDDSTVIKEINPQSYKELKESGAIFAGMIPKLDNAFAALSSGVQKVIIGKAEELEALTNGSAGTTIALQ